MACRISSTESASHQRSLAGRPSFFSSAKSSECLSRVAPSISSGPVENDAERALRGDRRVELFERTGRRVARIGEFGQARLSCAPRSVSRSRPYPGTLRRALPGASGTSPFNCFGTARIVRIFWVMSSPTVPSPAGRGITKLAVFVEQRNGDAIHLRLDHDRDFPVRQQPLHARGRNLSPLLPNRCCRGSASERDA